jgi:RNA polymerase sigma-70 factor, ECF subfamily
MKTAGPSADATGVRVSANENPGSGSLPLPVSSFKALYRQYFHFVWSSARRFGIPPDAMDDLVQEVFIVIHAKLDSLERPEALYSWIYGVVRRTASNYRRALRSQQAAGILQDAAGEAESQEPTPFERLKTNADLELLGSLIAELDEPKREVFELIEIDELTVPEAAEVLEIPLNTAYSRLRAARQAFEAAVARRGDRSKGT